MLKSVGEGASSCLKYCCISLLCRGRNRKDDRDKTREQGEGSREKGPEEGRKCVALRVLLLKLICFWESWREVVSQACCNLGR